MAGAYAGDDGLSGLSSKPQNLTCPLGCHNLRHLTTPGWDTPWLGSELDSWSPSFPLPGYNRGVQHPFSQQSSLGNLGASSMMHSDAMCMATTAAQCLGDMINRMTRNVMGSPPRSPDMRTPTNISPVMSSTQDAMLNNPRDDLITSRTSSETLASPTEMVNHMLFMKSGALGFSHSSAPSLESPVPPTWYTATHGSYVSDYNAPATEPCSTTYMAVPPFPPERVGTAGGDSAAAPAALGAVGGGQQPAGVGGRSDGGGSEGNMEIGQAGRAGATSGENTSQEAARVDTSGNEGAANGKMAGGGTGGTSPSGVPVTTPDSSEGVTMSGVTSVVTSRGLPTPTPTITPCPTPLTPGGNILGFAPPILPSSFTIPGVTNVSGVSKVKTRHKQRRASQSPVRNRNTGRNSSPDTFRNELGTSRRRRKASMSKRRRKRSVHGGAVGGGGGMSWRHPSQGGGGKGGTTSHQSRAIRYSHANTPVGGSSGRSVSPYPVTPMNRSPSRQPNNSSLGMQGSTLRLACRCSPRNSTNIRGEVGVSRRVAAGQGRAGKRSSMTINRRRLSRQRLSDPCATTAVAIAGTHYSNSSGVGGAHVMRRNKNYRLPGMWRNNPAGPTIVSRFPNSTSQMQARGQGGSTCRTRALTGGGGGSSVTDRSSRRGPRFASTSRLPGWDTLPVPAWPRRSNSQIEVPQEPSNNHEEPEQQEIVIEIDTMAKEAAVQTIITSQVTAVLSLADHGRPVTPDLEVICDGCDPIRNSAHKGTLARAVPRMLARCFSPGSISLAAGMPGSAAGSTPTSSGMPSSSERVARSRSDISVACGGSLGGAGARISGGRQHQTRMRPWSGSDAHRLRQHLMTFCKRCDSTTVRSRLAAPQSLHDTTIADGGKGGSAPVAVKALGAIKGSASRSRSRSASAGGESVDGKSVKSGKSKRKSAEKKSGGSVVEKKRGAESLLKGTSAGRGDMGEGGVGAGDSEPEDGPLSPAECPKAQLRAFAESIGLRYSTSPIEAASEPSEDSECASAGSLEPREMDLGASPESADVSLASADSKGALPDHLLPSAGCRALRLRGDKVVLSLPCELNVSKVEVGADSAMSPGHCTATAAAAAKAAATGSSNGSASAASSPMTSAAGVAPLHGCARVPCGAHSLDVRPRDGGVELALLVSASCGALFHLQVDISQTVGIRLTELPKEASDALPLSPRAITAPGDPKIRSRPESGAAISAQGPLAAAMAAAVAAAAEAAGDSPLSASPLGSPLCLGPSAHMGSLPGTRLALPRPLSPPSLPRSASRDSLSDAEQQAMETDMKEVAGGDGPWPECESVDLTRKREGRTLGVEMAVENIDGRSTLSRSHSDSSDSIRTPIVPRSRERSNTAGKGTASTGRGATKTRVRHSHPHLAPPVSRHDRLTPTERKSSRVTKGKGKGSRSGQRVPSKSNERTSSERRSNMSLGTRFDSVRNIRQPILPDTKRTSRNDRRSTPLRSSLPSPERRSVQGRKSSHEGRQRRRTEGSCGGSSGLVVGGGGSGVAPPKPQSPRRSGTASPIRRGSQTRSPRRAKAESGQQLGFPECFARLIRPVKEPKHEEEDEDCEETRTRGEGDERSMEVPASQGSDPSDHSDVTMIAAQPKLRARRNSPRLEVLMKHPSNQFYESSSSQTIDPSSREVNIQTERSDRLRIQSFAQLSQALDALSGRISRLKKMSLPRALEKRPTGVSTGRGGSVSGSPSSPQRGASRGNEGVEEGGGRQKRRGGGGRKGFVSWPASAAAANEAEADTGKPARSPGKLAGQSLHERAGSYTLIHSSIAMQSFDPATSMQSFRRFVFQTRDEQHQVLQNIFPKHLGRGFFHVPTCFVDGKVVEEEGEENNPTENKQPTDENIINVVEEEVLEERVVQDMGIILKTEIKTSKIVIHETQECSKKKTEDHSDFSETDLDTSRISCSSLETEIISYPDRDRVQDTVQDQKDSGQYSNFSPEDNQNDFTSDTFQGHHLNLDSTHNLDSISSLPLYPATEPHRMGTGSAISQGVWDLDDSYFLSKDTLDESISIEEVKSEIFPETTKSALFVDDVRRAEEPDLAREVISREDKHLETSPTELRSPSTPSFLTCTEPTQTNDLVRLRASTADEESATPRDDDAPSENGLTEVLPRNFVVNSSIILLSVSVWSWLNSYLGEDR